MDCHSQLDGVDVGKEDRRAEVPMELSWIVLLAVVGVCVGVLAFACVKVGADSERDLESRK